ncbi:MAG TPA: YtcA family lipoprotein [Terracidiphilus sp.]|jgi:YtcA family
MNRRGLRAIIAAVHCSAVSGCARAPSVDVLGSYFPAWLVSLAASVVLSFFVRWLLLRYRLEGDVGPLQLFYPCLILLFTCLIWLIFAR